MIARAEARSWPIGFSSTTRERSSTRPAAASGADRPEQIGRRRHEEDADFGVRAVQRLADRSIVFDLLRIDAPIVEALRKAREEILVEAFGRDELDAVFLDARDILLAGQLLARDADDAAVAAEIAVAVPVVQRRQQLAHRKVAGAAEEDELDRSRIGHWVAHGDRSNIILAPVMATRSAPTFDQNTNRPCARGKGHESWTDGDGCRGRRRDPVRGPDGARLELPHVPRRTAPDRLLPGQPRVCIEVAHEGVALRRLTIFAKGNLDVRDALHSLRVGGKVQWNGINAVVRARFPSALIQVRHETWSRSDALVASGGSVPADLAERKLSLGAQPAAAQFSVALFETNADAIVLSVQADVASTLARHKRNGYLFHPGRWQTWSEADRRWLQDEFVQEGLLDVDPSMHNFAQIVARIRERSAAPILVYNVSAVVPGDTVHCHAGMGETLATRIRRFNLGVAELSQRTGISVIDVDAVIARAGAEHLKLDAFHLNAEGCRLVAEETVRVLDDLGFFPATTPTA